MDFKKTFKITISSTVPDEEIERERTEEEMCEILERTVSKLLYNGDVHAEVMEE